MAQKLDDREMVTIPEALQAEMVINQALIDLLIEKGIITEPELMDRISAIKAGIAIRVTEP